MNWRIAVTIGVGIALAVAAGMFADGYLGYLLVWGGSECTSQGEMLTCYGYPPTGITFLTAAGVGLSAWLASVTGFVQPTPE